MLKQRTTDPRIRFILQIMIRGVCLPPKPQSQYSHPKPACVEQEDFISSFAGAKAGLKTSDIPFLHKTSQGADTISAKETEPIRSFSQTRIQSVHS